MPVNEGSYGIESLALLPNKGTFTDIYDIRTPTVPYEPRFYWDGGGLQ